MAINKYAKMQKSYEEELAKTRAELNAQKAKFDAATKAGASKSGSTKKTSTAKKSTTAQKAANVAKTVAKAALGVTTEPIAAKAIANAAKKKTSTAKKTSAPTVNKQSVLNTGYGPVSGSRLAQLEAQGKVATKRLGNQIVASKTNPTAAKKAVSGAVTGAVTGGVGKKVAKPLTKAPTSSKVPNTYAAKKNNVMTSSAGATIKKPTATKKNEWQ